MIKPNFVAAYQVDTKGPEGPLYLLLKRSEETYLPGIWQMVTGKIEQNESAAFAVVREMKEETGLTSQEIYNVDVTMFYNQKNSQISFSSNFCAYTNSKDSITLSKHEHSEYKWCSFKEALSLLAFPAQKETLSFIHHQFVMNKPHSVNLVEVCLQV